MSRPAPVAPWFNRARLSKLEEARKALGDLAPLAVETLEANMRGPNAAMRDSAARYTLDQTLGKPKQRVEIEHKDSPAAVDAFKAYVDFVSVADPENADHIVGWLVQAARGQQTPPPCSLPVPSSGIALEFYGSILGAMPDLVALPAGEEVVDAPH